MLIDLLKSVDATWVQLVAGVLPAPEITPISALLSERQQAKKPDADSFKKLRIPVKTKLSPLEVALQYFHELMFIRAIGQVK